MDTFIELKPSLTWGQLQKAIEAMTPEQHEQPVTAYHAGLEETFHVEFTEETRAVLGLPYPDHFLNCDATLFVTPEEFASVGYPQDLQKATHTVG
jgi:hypothetical protein